jgi:hypothetical protein
VDGINNNDKPTTHLLQGVLYEPRKSQHRGKGIVSIYLLNAISDK